MSITHIHIVEPGELISIARGGKGLLLGFAESDNIRRGDKIRLQTNPHVPRNGDMIIELQVERILESKALRKICFENPEEGTLL